MKTWALLTLWFMVCMAGIILGPTWIKVFAVMGMGVVFFSSLMAIILR